MITQSTMKDAYIPLDSQTVSEAEHLETSKKETKNSKDSALVWPLLAPQPVHLTLNRIKI